MVANEVKMREAGEVFLYMHRIFRASRNLRAHWYIDHLGKPISIKEVPQASTSTIDPSDEYGQEMTVVGIVPAGGDGTEIVGDEEFIVTVDTKCVYISRYYRIVFVLDLSPSVVVADDESNCCLVDRIIPSLRNALRSSVKAFRIPGTDRVFRPQVHTSICLFTPFMKFEEMFTLCQGVFITEVNVDQVIESIEKQFVDIFKRLFTFSRPILEMWGKLRRRHKHNKFDSLCESESQSDDNIRDNLLSQHLAESPSQYYEDKYLQGNEYSIYGGNIMTMPRGIWTATERHEDNRQLAFASDKSYVTPDWSLIFMLRMGLLQIQMLPENTQSNLVIISDSVCGMPDEEALQNVLTQLRSYTVAFSFIQLQKNACTEPVFGHVGSSSLFYFMTMATFGTYLPRQKPRTSQPPVRVWRKNGALQIERTVEQDDIIDESSENINQFHRALICWSFQNGLNDNDYLLDTFAQINRDFLELQQSHVDRHRRFVADYEATLNRMMYVRLREGFTLKSTVFIKQNTQVILTLRLAFRPLVFIDYIITSVWPVNKNEHQWVNVELVLEGPYNELKDLLTESNYLNPIRMNIIKSVIDGIIDADRLLLHIHAFDMKSAFFTIPPGVTTEYALFQQGEYSRQILPQLCIVKEDGTKTRGFVNFWKKMLRVDDSNWQKWVHTQTERGLLNLIHVPFEMFTTQRVLKFDCRYPLNAVLYTVKVRASFCLVENLTYVTLVYESESSKKPLYFFIRKVMCNGPVAIIKTAFLGGVTSIARRRAVEAQRQRLMNVTYGSILNEKDLEKEARRYRYEANAEKLYMDPKKIYEKRAEPAFTVFRRPLERMVVRYTHVPADLTTIVRAEEKTDDPDEIMLLTLHNTLAKSLACRRSVIILNTFQVGGAYIVRLLADFCQNVLMHKRMHQENFRPAWTFNNAVSLLRQVYDSSGASLEQFIMFPSICVQPDAKGNPILRRKSKQEMEKENPEGDNDKIRKNGMPLRTQVETLAIVCEMWNEPAGGDPDDQLGNMSAEQRLNEDLRFISVLFTLDKIIRSSGSCNENDYEKKSQPKTTTGQLFPYDDRCRCTDIYELTGIPKKAPQNNDEKIRMRTPRPKSKRRTEKLKSAQDIENERQREEKERIAVPKPPEPGIFPIRYVPRKSEREEELLGELDEPFPYEEKEMTKPLPTVTDIHADAVSKFVTVYNNLFSLTNLIYHAQRKYLPLPHFVLERVEKDMARCNALQLNALHCQLSELADLSWEVDETEIDIVFADLVKTLPEAERPKTTPLRVYVKALTARMAALVFVPQIQPFDVNSKIVPMFLLTVHETQIAHCYASDAFDKYGIVSVSMSDVPEKWDSAARFGWTPSNRNVFPEEVVNFTAFCQHLEDEILPRIRMRAMYEAAQEGILLNETSLWDMSGEVECLEFEMSAVPIALRKVCQHLETEAGKCSPSSSTICCRGSNIDHMFNKMLSKNFKKVNGTENMFYLNADTLSDQKPKVKPKRRRSSTRGSGGVMYVDGADSVTSLSEVADFDFSGHPYVDNGEFFETDDDKQTASSGVDDSSDTDSTTTSDEESSPFDEQYPETSDHSEPEKIESVPLKTVEGEAYVEYTGKSQPMFIQFNCSVNFDGEINTFPINFLPTCIHELIPFIKEAPSDPEKIKNAKIVIELVVITTQSLRPIVDVEEIKSRLMTMSRSRVRNPYEFERHRRESYRKEDEIDMYESNMSSDDEENEKHSEDVLFDLPMQERKVMTDLVKNVGVVLELEKILLDSRKEVVDEKLLDAVKTYIEEACTTTGKVGHAETRYKPFLMVDGSKEKIEKFMSLLDGRECGYLKLVKLNDTNMFYCRSINNRELYEAMKDSGSVSLSSSITGEEIDDQFSDFWLILTVDAAQQSISVHFCQRHEHQHTHVLENMWTGIRQELRVLNQESLLEMMYTRRRCDKLLVPEYRKTVQFEDFTSKQSPPKTTASPESASGSSESHNSPLPKNAADQKHEGDLPDDLYYFFAEGYFACPVQKELWINVPERVRNQSMLFHKLPLHMAFENIKVPLRQFGVLNRMNTFVYKDPENKQIFYFQLHMELQSYELAVKGTKKKLNQKQREKVEKSLETNICLTMSGINEPPTKIIKMVLDLILEKLDDKLLVEIMRGYSQNQEQPLLANEIAFLQPVERRPTIRKFFSIPFIFQEYLSSLLFYIGQHIEEINSISPAKVKEDGVFYNGAAFLKAPVLPNWELKRKRSGKRVEHVSIDENGIDVGVEAKEGFLRGISVEEKPLERPQRIELPPPPQPPPESSTIFRAQPPIAGEMPPDYSLSSFFIYHILPASGILKTGLALIEFRITKPDGQLISRFDQPSMNEQSHHSLVPNVPDDKATVYRDIIKSQELDSPKMPPEKNICGYVEMIIWTKGEVEEAIFGKVMHELIEMSMFDVITEFGYLNTTIVEEGVLAGHVGLANRNSDVFLPSHDTESSELRKMTKQGSASSMTQSVDRYGNHGEVRKSLIHVGGGGSVDIGMSPVLPVKTAAARMSSIAKDIEHSLRGDDNSLRRQDYMSSKNAYSIIKWLDYVASKQGETNSVVKQRIRFEFQHSTLPALFEIRNRLEVSLGGLHESDIRERVYLCGLRKPSTDNDSHSGVTLRESSLSIYGAPIHDARFEVLTTDPFHAMTEDVGIDDTKTPDEYILVSFIRNVFDGYGENMIRTKTQVDDMTKMFKNHLHGKYSPLVQTHMYCPRQRIMMAYLKGDFMTIYFYNYHSNILKEAVDCTHKIVGFHNAKSRLLREIGLHKMGITHLSPFHTDPTHEYDYEVLIWTDPMTLISKEFPIDHKPPPAYMNEPQCSNIFFRMYRQPDLQDTMGRSMTLFMSDCVKTMHYEQMLRWRSGLKKKIDYITKVTKAHVQMIRKVSTIDEADLHLFIRPPKSAKRNNLPPTHAVSTTSINVRHRHQHHHNEEDPYTEENTSMTEKTSKRASMYGESLKSHAITEAEIFKGKGDYLRKNDLKMKPAATKFHEIRTPLFLRSSWNVDAPRRVGELYDEVVREVDIRSMLEEPLKEFVEISEVQKTKQNKQLMKRKYSEKNVDVTIADVIVKNEERQNGEEETNCEKEEEWSEEDSDWEEESAASERFCFDDGAGSSRSNSESRTAVIGDENFQRTYGKVRRCWRPNPPSSPLPIDSRHNSISSTTSMVKPAESGPIEKMFSFTINAATKITRRLSRRQPEKEPSIDKADELRETPPSPSTEMFDPSEEAKEPPVHPIMYKHAEEFSRYFTSKYGFVQCNVENQCRRSKMLNRYTTSSSMFLDPPFIVFYKAYDGGIIFADLRYDVPDFVVSFYMYERAKMASADYYMIDQMESLYWKESEELHGAAKQLKLQDSVCFMTFNFDYHIRAAVTFLEAKANQNPCIFGNYMNVFHMVERLLDFYQHDLILSKNLVAMKYIYMTKNKNDEILERFREEKDLVLLKLERDPVYEKRYAGTPIEDAVCRITESRLSKTNHPVTIIEITGILGPSSNGSKLNSRVVPSLKLSVQMDDIGDGELFPPAESREFIESFEGKQRRRLLENISKYGIDLVPTPWEDSCVRKTVRQMLATKDRETS